MSNTINEIDLYLTLINKFHDFVPLQETDIETKENIMSKIKANVDGYHQVLNEPTFTIPGPFRKELEERLERMKDYNLDNIYIRIYEHPDHGKMEEVMSLDEM